MTAAQAQLTTSAAIGAGYITQTNINGGGDWTVIVSPGKVPLDLQQIATFAAANGISGTTQSVSLK
jgi:hypothetical protein